jgi:tRNA(Ile)-lysidine synthase
VTDKQIKGPGSYILTLASSFLARTIQPAPPSTLFIFNSAVSLSCSAKLAVIIRVLRYVSCRPWGCVSAESSRRSHSLNTITSRVFAANSAAQKLVPFSAGSDVLWVPASLRSDGSVQSVNESGMAICGWLAQRLPPPSTPRLTAHAGMVTFIREHTPHGQPRVLTCGTPVDIGSDRVFHFLFDCRFVVHFDFGFLPDAVKQRLGRIKHLSMAPVGKFSLPSVLLTGNNAEQYYWELPEDPVMPGVPLHTGQRWVAVEFARTLLSP